MENQISSDLTAIDHRLTLLKTRFADRTASQLDTMLRELQGGQHETFSHGNLMALYQLLDRLAESSGTFGFIELEQQAGKLEQRIKPLLDSPDCSASRVRNIVDADHMGRYGGKVRIPTLWLTA
ncbi:Hpt domain-containing protein [Oceanisphaera arctica]|uniref:Uncharacterized protein n=1 Tax=Oceanisphaera arctica TaxID=641510 RepID=A0A2P5TLU3_9GAMM|nr:Hpt domain-containing protein [Oceanisphaera arctica]PPL16355.1 hypothetical protein UN63_09010 [Oceanisphaera arctica]GHA14260.1 hypothetical protein GCM10007082_13960 [Oceanisphaera arctica]